MLYAFFWVIPRRPNFICGRFGTPYLFLLHRQVGVKSTYPPMKMKQTEFSETDVYVAVHRVKFLIIKPTRCNNFSNLFLE